MGSVVDKAKDAVETVSGISAIKGLTGAMTPPEVNTPNMEAPTPVAPATQQSANVQQAKDDARRKLANQSGRSQSSVLDVEEANLDEEQDILG